MHEKQQNPQELIDGTCFPSLMKMKGLVSLSGQTIWSEESLLQESKTHLEPALPTSVDSVLACTWSTPE